MNIRYWLCQVLGWGTFGLIHVYINLVMLSERFSQHGGENEYIVSLCIYLVSGILSTHILRTVAKRTHWLRFSFNRFFILFIIGIAGTSLIMQYGGNFLEKSTPYSFDKYIQNYKLEKAKEAEAKAGLDRISYYSTTPLKDSANLKAISDIKKSTGWYRNGKGEWKYDDKLELLGIYQNMLLIALWFFDLYRLSLPG